MVKVKYANYCSFGRFNKKEVLSNHISKDAALKKGKKLAKIYHCMHGWRLWTEDSNGKIIYDTNKDPYICKR